MSQNNHQTSGHLVASYNQMMASIRNAFENTDTSDISLQNALNSAKDQAVHLGELTLDEIQEISEYIKRDINDAAEYLMESSSEFNNWLMLDIEVMERKVVDLFLSVADRTRIELEQIKDHHREQAIYNSGEITGPGTLQCTECGQLKPFLTTSEISDCSKCGCDTFMRAEVKQESE